ncbi:MAG TPA: enolase C-terminal domain-like protein [Steroidobacteraceae bacterium]|nr:enolase C-terminal domain-like protein [Steroidobacteraceae bacterium]
MKVTGVKVTPFAHDLPTRSRSTRAMDAGTSCVVELSSDAGVSGIGVACCTNGAQIDNLVQHVLKGEDPRGIAGLWQRMVNLQAKRTHGEPCHEAIAVLDVALWDLKAKREGQPLWKTLGGSRPRANACASLTDAALDEAQVSAWFERMAHDFGLRAGKLRLGLDPDKDLQRLARTRAALSRAVAPPTLAIDLGQSWPTDATIRNIRDMEQEFDLAWVEGACDSSNVAGLKQISNAISAAVSVGRGLGVGEFLPHFQHRSADVIEIDIGRVGITGALQIADAAFGYELPVTLTAAPGNIHAHLAGVMPSFMSLEVLDPASASRLWASEVRIEDGWAIAGDAPGNGLSVK